MRAVTESIPFEALDECHRQIMVQLERLTELARRIETHGFEPSLQERARAIESFFSGTSREHHLLEEKSVFPPLIALGDPALTATVESLQQDHGWIEENWIELAPQLSAIGSGNNWPDPAEFLHGVQVFVDLCKGHIGLEETVVFPQSRELWARTVEARKRREKVPPA